MHRRRLRQTPAVARRAGSRPTGHPRLGPARERRRSFWLSDPTASRCSNAHLARFQKSIAEELTTNTPRTVRQRSRNQQGLRVGETTFRRYVQAHVQRVTEKYVTLLKT